MDLTLVFVRHAHRDTSERSSDNGLDEKGFRQVKDLLEDLTAGKLPPSSDFRTSPKKRCVQTLSPLAEAQNKKLVVTDALDEQGPGEGSKEFQRRIFSFLETFQDKSGTIYLCSHGDWLPEAVQDLTGQFIDIKKGEYALCQRKAGKWKLK